MPVESNQQIPINVVGSSIFGVYPKISVERTYNMYISDEWMVNYPGWQAIAQVFPSGQGRALFNSVRGGFMLGVFGNSVYRFNADLKPIFIATLATASGEVIMDENLLEQICIVDGEFAYIYQYTQTNFTFTQQVLTFVGNPITPSYVCFHNTFFLIAGGNSSVNAHFWYAFLGDGATSMRLITQFQISTKPDDALAIRRVPGHGQMIMVLGRIVGEVWNQVGGAQNYQRLSSFNIDNGVVSLETVVSNEDSVAWIGQNESNSPAVFISNGSSVELVSTDGIDKLLESIQVPTDSMAIMFRQDGHLFYQFTFYNPKDNITLTYDLTTKKFFDVIDDDWNYHPARQLAYFNGHSYFVSLNDATLYEMDTLLTTYNYNTDPNILGELIPRHRICGTVRFDNSQIFRVNQFTFTIEQGIHNPLVPPAITGCIGELITESGGHKIVTELGFDILAEYGFCSDIPANQPAVDMSFSKDGNQSFSNIVRRELNPEGQYRNQIRWWTMGHANEFTIQLTFWGFQRFVVRAGVLDITVMGGA